MIRVSRSLRSPIRSSRGFTLQELCVSLLISSSLATGGIGMWSVVQESVMTAAANEIVTHLALARSEAIKHRLLVRMCPSKDQRHCAKADTDYTFWQYGWLVFADKNKNGEPDADEIVRIHQGIGSGLAVRTSRHRSTIAYRPLGTAGGSTVTFALCDSRGPASARYVTISNTGRARVTRTSTSTVRCT